MQTLAGAIEEGARRRPARDSEQREQLGLGRHEFLREDARHPLARTHLFPGRVDIEALDPPGDARVDVTDAPLVGHDGRDRAKLRRQLRHLGRLEADAELREALGRERNGGAVDRAVGGRGMRRVIDGGFARLAFDCHAVMQREGPAVTQGWTTTSVPRTSTPAANATARRTRADPPMAGTSQFARRACAAYRYQGCSQTACEALPGSRAAPSPPEQSSWLAASRG